MLKPGYQVLMNMDWFGQHWVLGARDIEFWLSLRNITVFLVLGGAAGGAAGARAVEHPRFTPARA